MNQNPRAKSISYEYIRGLVEGEGCFTFCAAPQRLRDGTIVKNKIPEFIIAMHERDEGWLMLIRNTLGLKSSINKYKHDNKDGYNRGRMAILMVRNLSDIRTIIIPLFYKRLIGNKGKQFEAWIEKIGHDPDVPLRFRTTYGLYKSGFYDKYPKF